MNNGKDYTNQGAYNFPSDDVSPEVKRGKNWCKEYSQAIYSQYVRGLTGVRFSRVSEYDIYRLYGEGRQPTEKYMDRLCPKDKRSGKREGYMNISWDIVSVLPKFRAIVIGMFDRIDHDINADAIDEAAGAAKEQMEFEVLAEKLLQDTLAPIMATANIEKDNKEFPILPSSVEEMDVLRSVGAFKLKQEIAIEKAIKYSFYISNWREIKRRIYGDIFDLGIAASRDYTCRATGKTKAKYVDPRNLLVRYTNSDTFDNIDYCGELITMTLGEFREAVGDDIDVETLNQIIERNAQRNSFDYDDFRSDDIYSLFEHYDSMVIRVLDVEWKSIDSEYQERKVNQRGEEYAYNQPYGYSKSENENRKILVAKNHNVYRCKWVVDTEYVFDNGQQYDLVTEGDSKKATLSYNIFRLSRKSIVSQLIPIVDQFQLTWLKLQNAIAKAAPSGLAVDVDTLKNVTDGKNNLTPRKILELKLTTGDLLYSASTHHSQVLNPNAGRAVTPLVGGVGPIINEFILMMDKDLDLIRQITGISEVMDGSAPQASALVGTTEYAASATNNILHNFYIAYRSIKERTANRFAKRLQITARYKEIKGYYPSLGQANMEVIKIGSDITMNDFGIMLTLRPTEREKQTLTDGALRAVQAGALKYSDYIYLMRIVNTGNVKYAEVYLRYKEQEMEKQQLQLQKENMEMNQQGQAAMEQQKAQAAMQQQQIETESEIAVEGTKSKLRIGEDDNKFENEVEIERLRGELVNTKEQIRGQNQKEVEEIKKEDLF